jgi:hypothetical protein
VSYSACLESFDFFNFTLLLLTWTCYSRCSRDG